MYDRKGKYQWLDPVSSAQIKSATENNGDFSRENPDIRYSTSAMDQEYMAAVEAGDMEKHEKFADDYRNGRVVNATDGTLNEAMPRNTGLGLKWMVD